MSKNLICYFSATGNSLQAAKDISAKLHSTDIVPMTRQHVNLAGYERVGFIFPCFGGGLPNIVRRFISALVFPENTDTYYFTVVTGGEHAGNCVAQVNRLLTGKGVSLHYGSFLKMYGNYLILHPQPNDADEQAARAHLDANTIADDVLQKKRTTIPRKKILYSITYALVAPNFHKGARTNFKVTDACVSCGKCVQVCPVGNITLKDGKPVFGNKCELCVACIQWCPQKAIIGGKATGTSPRYHHPEVSFEEICSK